MTQIKSIFRTYFGFTVVDFYISQIHTLETDQINNISYVLVSSGIFSSQSKVENLIFVFPSSLNWVKNCVIVFLDNPHIFLPPWGK